MADEAQGDLLTETSQTETTSFWLGDENKDWATQKGWTSPDKAPEVAKSYKNLEALDSGKIKMPTPESSAEEIRAFYQRTGCPENPDGYELEIPEDVTKVVPRDEGIESELKKIAHENGVSKQAFESIVKGYYEKLANEIRVSREAGEKALKQEWGDKYDEELNIAKRFCDTCSDEFKELLEKTGLGNNAVFVKEFASKGRQTMSDTLIKSEGEEKGEEGEYKPEWPQSPDMYQYGEDEESKKARAYFEKRGHKY